MKGDIQGLGEKKTGRKGRGNIESQDVVLEEVSLYLMLENNGPEEAEKVKRNA